MESQRLESYTHLPSDAIRYPAGKIFLVIMGVALTGYAFLGRGFAYAGIPPIFIGEIVLAMGLLTWILVGGLRIFESRITWVLILLMGIGALGTFRYVETYGMDALRDGSLWGYGIFALIVGTFLLKDKDRIQKVAGLYSVWIGLFFVWVIVSLFIRMFAGDLIPRWPYTNVPLISLKNGDIAVHLAGAMAFLALGLHRIYGRSFSKRDQEQRFVRSDWWLWGLLIASAIIVMFTRAAILTLVATAILLIIIRPSKSWIKPIMISGLILFSAITLDLEFNRGGDRSVSPQALVQAFESIFQETGAGYHDGSRRWRLDWWGDIWNYTVRGEYFWTGKGYGINLADADGFQVFGSTHEQAVLRSPHNSHLTFLARSGVPGFSVWIALQLLFALTLIQAYRKARCQGREDFARLNLWVLAYWWAFMMNAGFDVFLEGPQGGIWFWSLFGFGLALLIWQKNEMNNGSSNSRRI